MLLEESQVCAWDFLVYGNYSISSCEIQQVHSSLYSATLESAAERLRWLTVCRSPEDGGTPRSGFGSTKSSYSTAFNQSGLSPYPHVCAHAIAIDDYSLVLCNRKPWPIIEDMDAQWHVIAWLTWHV